MDAFDGDSDLSEVSPPPTPGPAAKPRAESPGAPLASSVVDSNLSAPALQSGAEPPQPTPIRRKSRLRAGSAATPTKDEFPSSEPATVSVVEPSTSAQPIEIPARSRRLSGRDRKPNSKYRQTPSPAPASAEKSSVSAAASEANTPRSTKLKVTLKRSGLERESGSSRGASPQPPAAAIAANGTKLTIKEVAHGKGKKPNDNLRDLGDDDDDDQLDGIAAREEADDEFRPDVDKPSNGKRDRTYRSGRRKAAIADDEDDDEDGNVDKRVSKAPQRKRAKISNSPAIDTKSRAARSTRGARKRLDYSDADEDNGDEEMVDAASSEEELDEGSAVDSDDGELGDGDDGLIRGGKAAKSGKAAGSRARKFGVRASTSSTKASATAGPIKKAAGTGAGSASSAAGGKNMSAADRMRASIDAAKNKSLRPPGVASGHAAKLNPLASAFRPNAALKSGGSSTPVGAGRPGTTSTSAAAAATAAGGAKRSQNTGGKPAFGKSMSGWDQLFGPLSGLAPSPAAKNSPTSAGKPKSSIPSNSTGANGSGIRPDPVLESASAEEVQKLKQQAVEDHLNTDECFDLLAHADIMMAFERSVYMDDKRLAMRLRPAFWKAGTVLMHKQQGQAGQ
ncbi:uncharacterized protein MEPE_04718 [Melanopsichium pennsylvanicum]|uniref:Uncharacterized protein n=2 Tax=Melanopsichium pennsylvanicum TaxID=63383 RepID=A0AAJ5C705_9BASI|nr:uncharacterized protein BN887_01638 [Melanopsichium pennsylvanicum 4]SNX86009.1 uncharacterized protein MEPE_04718 [Melanopsichium pennsylvanicum]